MKATVMHESKGRMRVRMMQKSMSLEQADKLELYLQKVPGVTQASVHERTCCAIIYYSNGRGEILEAIGRFGYGIPEVTAMKPIKTSRALNRMYQEKLVKKILWKAICTLFLPEPLKIARSVWHALPFLKRGLWHVFRGHLRVEVLDALSIGVSMGRRDFGTAGSIMFLLEIGELLEEWTHKKSVDDLARCMALNVDTVWLKRGEEEMLVPLSHVEMGDSIAVRMGNIIPLDGVILEGEVMVNQASLTGESIPVAKYPGTAVYAGTVVEEGDCVVKVTRLSGESRYDKIVKMIENSERLKSTAEDKASNLADKLVPFSLAGSLLSLLLTRNTTRALSVIMVDFSCALKLAMPLAVLSAMREASQYHMTVKGGKFLEAVAKADTIVFDKTGTLTYACPKVVKVIPFGGRSEREMLRVAACLEEHFPHSMANAVVRAAQEQKLAHEEMHSQVEYLVAHGISSTVDGEKVIIGSAHFVFEDEKSQILTEDQEKFDKLPAEYSHLYLAIGGWLAAVICISDPLRKEAKDVIKTLRKLGIDRMVMLTGDSTRTAMVIAKEVGVDSFRAEVLPEDKALFVEEERKAGHIVIMVGDGVNDSPALSAADVGIAISEGAAIAREIADITIGADNLYELVTLRRIAQGLMKRIDSNYRFVIGFNGGLIGLGVTGVLSPAASAMLHNISTLGISLRSMTNLLENK